jgi:hypothetical protein
MTRIPATHSKLTFFLDSKLHENLKIRLYYDQIKTQSEFFRCCVESYLSQDIHFMEFLDHYKVNNALQSKARTKKSRKLRETGSRLLEDLALTPVDIENIFDIIEEELPEL